MEKRVLRRRDERLGIRGGVQGIVLAGGHSRRFGSDKALALIDGRAMVERAVRLLKDIGLPATVVTAPGRGYPFLPCPLLHDQTPGRGPLSGLDAALRGFPGRWLLVLTCDMPYITRGVLRDLIGLADDRDQAVVYRRDSLRVHPFPGLYAPSLAETVGSAIHRAELSMHDLLNGLPAARILRPSGPDRLFQNINTVTDLQDSRMPRRQRRGRTP